MSDELAAHFPDRFVESELGPIPEGWRCGKLGDVAELKTRGIRPQEVEPTTPYIGLEHMPQREIALGEWGTADQVSSTKSRFCEGEILFGKLRPYFHKIGIAFTDGICSTDILVIKERREVWRGLVVGHLSSTEVVGHADATSSGTRQPRTSWRSLSGYLIPLPDDGLAERFSNLLAPMLDQLRSNTFESHTLAALRDLLLPKLLSGEIRLAQAEDLLEARGCLRSAGSSAS